MGLEIAIIPARSGDRHVPGGGSLTEGRALGNGWGNGGAMGAIALSGGADL